METTGGYGSKINKIIERQYWNGTQPNTTDAFLYFSLDHVTFIKRST